MKILVTGGAGFIGSHIVDVYLEAGHDVVVVDNLSSGDRENISDKADFHKIDIRDESALRKLFEKEEFDVVNHHAAQISVKESVDNPHFDAEVNILGSLHLAELSVEFGVEKFIFASTGGAIYGETNKIPTSEKHSPEPLAPYGNSKLAFEFYLNYYHTIKNLNYTILRYANVYGERQNPHGEAGVVAIFFNKIIAGEQPMINGDGEQTRDFTYVGDVARANLLALEKKAINTNVNIGTGLETDINTLFEVIVQATGEDVERIHGASRAGEQLRSALDASKAQKLLGWKPEVIVGKKSEETFKNIYRYFKKNYA